MRSSRAARAAACTSWLRESDKEVTTYVPEFVQKAQEQHDSLLELGECYHRQRLAAPVSLHGCCAVLLHGLAQVEGCEAPAVASSAHTPSQCEAPAAAASAHTQSPSANLKFDIRLPAQLLKPPTPHQLSPSTDLEALHLPGKWLQLIKAWRHRVQAIPAGMAGLINNS